MTKTKGKVDKRVIETIRKSSKKWGQLYPILEDANSVIIDGEHREIALTNPKRLKLPEIKTKKDRLFARLVANHARKGQHKSTWELTLDELAKILEKEGVEKIGMKIAEETGLPYRTLMRYLPSKYKDEAQSKRASHPRLPCGTPLPEEGSEEETTSAESLVQSPAKTTGQVHIHEERERIPAIEILDEYKDAVKDEMPKIEVKKYVNQPWKAIILPQDFFDKLERECQKMNLDMEEVVTLALVKVFEDLRRKNRCLERAQ